MKTILILHVKGLVGRKVVENLTEAYRIVSKIERLLDCKVCFAVRTEVIEGA